MTDKIADEWQAALLRRTDALNCDLPLVATLAGARAIERAHELVTVRGDAARLAKISNILTMNDVAWMAPTRAQTSLCPVGLSATVNVRLRPACA